MEQRLDVSALQPPEPMEQILDRLADLPQGDWLRVRHRREPLPLYPMLHDLDYSWRTRQLGPEQYDILIWPQAMGPAPADAAGTDS
ncbi:MAG: DUF2249 domain-containing protein [Gammaproteobacteria bacterium SHHR-1]|uniref:DUF2249 domain-containing protein n=1 Tax=Magnetovirga frankeli TaxID=947516 RepID=UPI00129310E1|nr:DUF2249 domain-containing protein [gamma proteobacterium SS-5]